MLFLKKCLSDTVKMSISKILMQLGRRKEILKSARGWIRAALAGSHPAAISWQLLGWAGAQPKTSISGLCNSSVLLDTGLGDG